MTPPRLNRKLVLESPERIPDGAGGFSEGWQALGVIWAEVVPRTGREVTDGSRLSLKITLRAVPQGSASRPTAAQRFRDGARLYSIDAVTEADPAGRYLVCFAHEEAGA